MTQVTIEDELDYWRSKALEAQALLGHVLLAVGVPVRVYRTDLDLPFEEGSQIRIDEDEENNALVIHVEVTSGA